MDEAQKIAADIKAGNIKPIYFLMGEEPYFIDKLAEFIENNVLAEEEKSFNQTIFYGRDVTIEDIVSAAKRYPMMADRQVIIVREAQDLSKTIDRLEAYANNPMMSTVLVFCYKYKKLDLRLKVTKSLKTSAIIFDSKRLYENGVSEWIKRTVTAKNYTIEPKAAAMLVEFLGLDLSKINNELEKLQLVLPIGSVITPKAIEVNIGFSKDYNVFELRKALGDRNQLKAYKIAAHFADNQKDNPIIMVTSLVFAFFSQVLQYHGLKDKSSKNVASVLKVAPYFVIDYVNAARNYPMKKVSQIVASLRIIDVKSKGVGSNLTPSDLLKEMLIHIFK